MKNVVVQLSQTAKKLKSISVDQKCTDCTLMQGYAKQQYQFLMYKTNSLKTLSQTNDMNIPPNKINDLVRFVAILGMYINV